MTKDLRSAKGKVDEGKRGGGKRRKEKNKRRRVS